LCSQQSDRRTFSPNLKQIRAQLSWRNKAVPPNSVPRAASTTNAAAAAAAAAT
jgi:hypothetical protein